MQQERINASLSKTLHLYNHKNRYEKICDMCGQHFDIYQSGGRNHWAYKYSNKYIFCSNSCHSKFLDKMSKEKRKVK